MRPCEYKAVTLTKSPRGDALTCLSNKFMQPRLVQAQAITIKLYYLRSRFHYHFDNQMDTVLSKASTSQFSIGRASMWVKAHQFEGLEDRLVKLLNCEMFLCIHIAVLCAVYLLIAFLKFTQANGKIIASQYKIRIFITQINYS